MAISEYHGQYLKLTFYSTNGSIKHTVYSEGIEPMKMFIKQHNFNPDIIEHVEPVPEHAQAASGSIIEPYTFKSKYSDSPSYTIYTTEDFVEEAINIVCADLAQSLMFGSLAIRTNIELFALVSDLIGELKYVYVLDHGLVDDETGELYSTDYEKYTKRFDAFAYNQNDYGYDDSYIYDSLHAASLSDEHISPITLESYVTYFADMITDEQ